MTTKTRRCLPEQFRNLIRESAQWHFLALSLLPPSEKTHREIQRLAEEIGDLMLRKLFQKWHAEVSSGAYFRVISPSGPISLRAVGHLPIILPGELLAELHEFYDRFGFVNPTSEAPDHAAVLAEFFAFLSFRAAYAVASGRESDCALLLRAREQFSERYLRPLLEKLVEKIESAQMESLLGLVRWMKDQFIKN